MLANLTKLARAPTLLHLVLLALCGCGRVGYELLPEESGGPHLDAGLGTPDGDLVDDSDAATDELVLDGSLDASARGDDGDSQAGVGSREGGALDGSILDARLGDGAPDAWVQDAAAGDASPQDAGVPDAGPILDSLVLRYDFAGTGTTVLDLVGTAHGRITGGAQLDGAGGLTLDGSDDYVDMPNRLVSGRSSVTMMAWFAWAGGPCWQRIFDFGSNDGGEGNSGSATSSLAVTAASCSDYLLMCLFEYQSAINSARASTLTGGDRTQVTLVVDGPGGRMTLYSNGAQVASTALDFRLSQVDDVNNWLGRSQWVQDHFLRGRFDEFRIYSRVLTAAEIAAANTRGPDRP